jgi:predicted amidohydrolase
MNIKKLILTSAVLITTILNYNLKANQKDNNQITVALLQLESKSYNLKENIIKGEEFCRKAKQMGADIILFPEIWSNNYIRYHYPNSRYTEDKYPLSFESWKKGAVDQNSGFIKHFQNLAKELNIAIVITYLETWKNQPRNSASLIGPDGKILMTYAKVHTSDMILTETNCTPGDDFYVCDLPIKGQVVKVGIMICFDREFPESARILMLKGAELILTPNACNLDNKRINQFQTRAYENSVAVAMANYSSPLNGRSCAFDANGDSIIVANDKESIVLASFNFDKIRQFRKGTKWGNAYRRPHKYKLLISEKVDSIFIRRNGKGEVFQRQKR